jgi:hypothetical protein
MSKESNIVHRYFRKKHDNTTILLKVNPIRLTGFELTRGPDENITLREVEFHETVWEDLAADGYEEGNPLEFNLYFSGLAQ